MPVPMSHLDIAWVEVSKYTCSLCNGLLLLYVSPPMWDVENTVDPDWIRKRTLYCEHCDTIAMSIETPEFMRN